MKRISKRPVSRAIICALFFAPAVFSADIPLADKFFSEETGRLYWELNDQYRIEYIYTCPRWPDASILLKECESQIKPINKYREDGEPYHHLSIGNSLLSSSSSNNNFQKIYEAQQANESATAEILDNSFRLTLQKELDISNIEQAKKLQIKHKTEQYKQHQKEEELRLQEYENEELREKLANLAIMAVPVAIFLVFILIFRSTIKNIARQTFRRCSTTLGALKKPTSAIKCRLSSALRASPKSQASELLALAKLKDDGHISEDEFQALKRKIISS